MEILGSSQCLRGQNRGRGESADRVRRLITTITRRSEGRKSRRQIVLRDYVVDAGPVRPLEPPASEVGVSKHVDDAGEDKPQAEARRRYPSRELKQRLQTSQQMPSPVGLLAVLISCQPLLTL